MFGQNRITPKQRNDFDGTLNINSIFFTLQGEMPYSGVPSIFIRFQGCNLACKMCFLGNTKIALLNEKDKKIKDVNVGDLVYSFDEKLNEIKPTKVLKKYLREVEEIYLVEFESGDKIYVTEEHPFYVIDKKWTTVSNLKEGDVVFNLTLSDRLRFENPSYDKNSIKKAQKTGNGLKNCKDYIKDKIYNFIHNGKVVKNITKITKESNKKAYVRLAGSLDSKIEVFNLETEGTHTYFANSCLVHNCDTEFDSGNTMTLVEIMQEVKALTPQKHKPLIVITGGEPFLQKGIVPLILELFKLENLYKVQIETAGTVFLKDFDKVLYRSYEIFNEYHIENSLTIVCSPKTGKINKDLEAHIDAYRYVISCDKICKEDGLPIVSYQNNEPLKIHRPKNKDAKIYISPCDEHDETLNLFNRVKCVELSKEFGYILSLQTHKILNLE